MKPKFRLAAPALLWLAFFILGPVLLVALVSFARRGTYGGLEWVFSVDNYRGLWSSTSAQILWDSFFMAGVTAFVCSFVGLFCAWAMATASESRRKWLLGLIAVPFLTNLIIRIYALKLFVGMDGPLQVFLQLLQVPFDPFVMTSNPVLVWYGLITCYLPFAILPLYGAFEKFDFSLVEAASDLGASELRVFTHVILPVLKGPLQTAFALVFVPCMGEYLIPDLLGGAKVMLVGNLITELFLRSRDWPMGSAVALALLSLLAVVLVGLFRSIRKAAR